MRRRLLGAALVATGIVFATGTALGASGAKDPLSLVLQRSDMPAKAKYTNGRLPTVEKAMAAGGIASSVAFHHSNIQRSLTKMDTVSGMVVTLKSPGDARKTYRLFKDDLAPKPDNIVQLPAYGDEQVAWWTPSVSKAELLVRKGSMVWQLEVNPDLLTKSQTLAQLRVYAVKQKRRIGSG
jgi:hypothetical protein